MPEMIHILMIGGKRCGKTTVLASMYQGINVALAGTSMQLLMEDPVTADYLNIAGESISQKMSLFREPLTRVEVDDNPTDAERSCFFNLKLENGVKAPFCIHDIPGEWLEDFHKPDVVQLVQHSQVIIIAIDTPYLFAKMTSDGYGMFHEEYNKPDLITNFFQESLTVEDISNRMILFVPIKCERYYHLSKKGHPLNIYHRNYMRELAQAVTEGYRTLITYLSSTPGLWDSCTLAITPILSAGGIDFVRFRFDRETGKMVALYQEPEFLPEEEKGYSPKFCEQPMIYALIHVLMQERRNHPERGGFFNLFGSKQTTAYIDKAIETLRKKLKGGEADIANNRDEGFYILQNPMGI